MAVDTTADCTGMFNVGDWTLGWADTSVAGLSRPSDVIKSRLADTEQICTKHEELRLKNDQCRYVKKYIILD